MNKYDEVSAIRSLYKKHGVSINKNTKVIKIDKGNNNLGNSSFGKVDFLCHYCGYTLESFTSGNNTDTENDVVDKKVEKREKKLNMVAMTKAAMKKVKDHA